jgi:thioredoxin-related protein
MMAARTPLLGNVILAGLALLFLASPVRAEDLHWWTDLDKAKEVAQRENKPILLLFTGTSWCGVCIVLEKKVLSQPEFAAFARKRLVLVKVEFESSPSKLDRKPTAEERAKIELARQFDLNVGQPNDRGLGGYPSVFLLSPKGERLAEVPSSINDANAGVEPFLEKLQALMPKSDKKP